VWNVYAGQAALKDPASTIPASKFLMIHRAVLDRCDGLDGLKDGLIGDPSRCSFDFKSLACSGEDSLPHRCTGGHGPDADESGGRSEKRRHDLSRSRARYGARLDDENRRARTESIRRRLRQVRGLENPDWDWRTFDLETAVVQADRIDVIDASADLRAFIRRGGKLLLYHGWADQNFSAQSTIDYYRKVVDTIGSATPNADSLRLFLAPGMGHCGGGERPNTFDMVSALERWVENNQALALIVASHSTDGKLSRTRPLCPYPQVAKHNGTGSLDEAANCRCVLP
jgi:feruloyl esterase